MNIMNIQCNHEGCSVNGIFFVLLLRMNNIINGEIDISSLKYINLTNDKFENYILQKNDVLFNRTNSKELVGKCAVFKLKGIYSFASYLIRLKLLKREGVKVILKNGNYYINLNHYLFDPHNKH